MDRFRPFISKDADIVGDSAMAERLAKISNWKLTCYYEPRTVGLAMLTKELPNNVKLVVEVIGSVNGLSAKELVESDLVELIHGQIYRIPSPIVLLKAKLANVAQIDQSRRQDVRHVKMLIPCVREYLRAAHAESLAGRMTERQLVNLFEASRSLRSDPLNLKLGRKHDFDLAEVFPMELSNSQLPKIAQFFRFGMTDPERDNDPTLPGKAKSKMSEWSLDSLIPPTLKENDRGKSREPEIEI